MTITSSGLKEIRQKLDPRYCYLVIEKQTRAEGDTAFSEIRAALRFHESAVSEETIYRDSSAEKLFLVLKLAPDHYDQIQQDMLSFRLSKTVTIYFYRNQTGGDPGDAVEAIA